MVAWGHFYRANPAVVTAGVQLLTDLVDGGYLFGLAQYGVGRGSVAGSVTIDTDSANPPPAAIDRAPLRNQLIHWLREGRVTPAPAEDEDSLLYFIFPDPATKLTLGTTTGFCGYHASGKLNGGSAHDDVFFAAIRADGIADTDASFMRRISFCVSHELGEAVTNRDGGGGWFDGRCEIGDICETKGNFSYRMWTVEQYWSNWDKGCVHGDRGLSLRGFVDAVHANPRSLRSLGMPEISVDTIASRFP